MEIARSPEKETAYNGKPDQNLLAKFNTEIRSRVPHWQEGPEGTHVQNPTPLTNITSDFIECARTEYGIELSSKIRVFGKLDSEIYGGSVKVRPMVQIIEDGIKTGSLHSGQIIFEATSGNFGLALGLLRSLGLQVITLVSRRLQEGVTEELERQGVKTVDLDIDICPAPGLQMDQNTLVANTIAQNVKQQLSEYGLDTSIYDKSLPGIVHLLARQDVIGLAKHLAKIYNGFCPEQYDNEYNVIAHETITGPEIDQQLLREGYSLADFRIITTFGTGGTSTGLSKYLQKKYGKKSVHVVYPLNNQDVAGIRTKDKSLGLRFYRPKDYSGQHEVDFDAAKPLFRFFARKGYNIGESSALALYACLQMLNFGVGESFVVVLADGIEKYGKYLGELAGEERRYEVSIDEARSSTEQYDSILWTHTTYAPKNEGIQLIASSLGRGIDNVKVARAQDVQTLVMTEKLPETLKTLIPDHKKILLVCMVGATSLRVAELLSTMGIEAVSVTGGVMGFAGTNGKSPSDIVQLARE
ncbi:MAG: cysteine synthase [Crenarchaeota archaeon 13_1_40CM_3_53_5]|nr:MAG: cysteine synthase [Crenarchaeota archaeon 13_1_40CM_3_53_5]